MSLFLSLEGQLLSLVVHDGLLLLKTVLILESSLLIELTEEIYHVILGTGFAQSTFDMLL